MRIFRVSPWLVEPNLDVGITLNQATKWAHQEGFLQLSLAWNEALGGSRMLRSLLLWPPKLTPTNDGKRKKNMGYSTMVGWVDTVTSKPQCGSTQLSLSHTFSADAIEIDPSVQPRSWHFGCRLLYPSLPWPTLWQMLVTWIPWMSGNGLLSLAASWAAWGLKN